MSDVFHEAMQYRDSGWSVIPLSEKKPVIEWKQYMERIPTLAELRQWFGFETRHNIGIVTGAISNLVVVDFDEKEAGRQFYGKHGAVISTVVETRRGAHFYFSHPGQQIRNSTGEFDVRGDGGYVVAPPSVVSDWEYKFVQEGELNPFPDFINSQNGNYQHRSDSVVTTSSHRVNDGMKYIMHIQAISGQRGHDSTFRAACALRDSGMGEADAVAAMVEWNQTNAEPPWTVKELAHKVKSAYAKG